MQRAASDFFRFAQELPVIFFNYMLIQVNSVVLLGYQIPILVISCNFRISRQDHFFSNLITFVALTTNWVDQLNLSTIQSGYKLC